MEQELNLISIIKILIKYKLFIFIIVVVTGLFGILTTRSQQKLYRATATILPSQGSQNNFLDLFGSSRNAYTGYSTGAGPLGAILKSRAVAKNVIRELDLIKILYKNKWDNNTNKWINEFVPSIESEALSLSGRLSGNFNENGLFEISITHQDPQLAADIANAYVKELRKYLLQYQLGISFQIIDPATIPSYPFSTSDRKKRIMTSVMISLVVSIFLAFFLNYLQEIKLLEKLKD